MVLTDPLIVQAPGKFVLQKTKELLQTQLSSPSWVSLIGQVGVTDQPNEALEWLKKNTHRPFCVLEISSCVPDREYNERGRWMVEIAVESVTTSPSSTSEQDLKAAVVSILEGAFAYFNALGIEESSAGTDGSPSGTLPERINPAFLSAAIHVAS